MDTECDSPADAVFHGFNDALKLVNAFKKRLAVAGANGFGNGNAESIAESIGDDQRVLVCQWIPLLERASNRLSVTNTDAQCLHNAGSNAVFPLDADSLDSTDANVATVTYNFCRVDTNSIPADANMVPNTDGSCDCTTATELL